MLKNSNQGNPGNSYGNFCFGPCNDTGISKWEDYQAFRNILYLQMGQIAPVPHKYMKHNKFELQVSIPSLWKEKIPICCLSALDTQAQQMD